MRHHGTLPRATLFYVRQHALERRILRFLLQLPLLHRWAEYRHRQQTARAYEKSWGQYQGCDAVLHELDTLLSLAAVRPEVAAEIRGLYAQWRRSAQQRLDNMAEQFPEFVSIMQERLARRTLLNSQIETLKFHALTGMIPHGVADEMCEQLYQSKRLLQGIEEKNLAVEPTELLQKVPLFKGLSKGDFARIAKQLRALTIAEGELIIRQGETGRSLYLIGRGVVRISHQSQDNNHDLATLFAGDFFGEMALLEPTRRTASCRAVTACALYELRHEYFESIRAICPALQVAVEAAAVGRKQI